MRSSGTEPSSVILCQTMQFKNHPPKSFRNGFEIEHFVGAFVLLLYCLNFLLV